MGKSDLKLIKEISRLSIGRGEVLMVKFRKTISASTIERMAMYMKDIMKKAGMSDVPLLFISDDVDIKVISKGELDD